MAGVNVYGGSGETQARHTFCTPKWLADLLPVVDLDPCSNLRSHVRARTQLCLEKGDNGLYNPATPGSFSIRGLRIDIDDKGVASKDWTTFINPPYARGEVIKWVKHYIHTDFMFLLRFDPSTEWFAALMKAKPWIWFSRERINFEPPPGVKTSCNPFPHALFCRHVPDQVLMSAGWAYQPE